MKHLNDTNKKLYYIWIVTLQGHKFYLGYDYYLGYEHLHSNKTSAAYFRNQSIDYTPWINPHLVVNSGAEEVDVDAINRKEVIDTLRSIKHRNSLAAQIIEDLT